MQDTERMEAPEEQELKPGMKRRKTLMVAGCVVMIALAVGGFAFASSQQASRSEASEAQTPKTAERGDEKGAESEKKTVTVRVEAKGWTEESTPVIVHVEGGGEDFYRALKANAEEALELAPGEYEFGWVSPVNADGSIYETGDAAKVEVGEDGAKVSAAFKRIETADATPEQVDAVLERMREAVERGGGSLPDGAAIVEKAEANAAKCGKSDEEKPAAEGEEAEQEAADEQASEVERPYVPAESGSLASQPSSGMPGSPQQPSQPERRWVEEQGHYEDVYEQQWVPHIVVVTPEQTVDVIIFSDGYRAYSEAEAKAYSKKTGLSYNFSFETRPAVTEDQGSYQQVKTGTKWVVDVPGHWE